jgi:hypothetical protein
MAVSETGLGGINFSKKEGKKEATNMKMVAMKMVSITHAIARSQNPANAGRGANAGSPGTAGITSGGCVLWGT